MKVPNHWLAKTEPGDYSFTQLERETETIWTGVRNQLALKYLRLVKVGDPILVYHTGDEKQIVGIAEAISDPYPDPKQKNPRLAVVKVCARRELPKSVTFAHLRKLKEFKKFELIRLPRLSFMPVPANLWDIILRIAEGREQSP